MSLIAESADEVILSLHSSISTVMCALHSSITRIPLALRCSIAAVMCALHPNIASTVHVLSSSFKYHRCCCSLLQASGRMNIFSRSHSEPHLSSRLSILPPTDWQLTTAPLAFPISHPQTGSANADRMEEEDAPSAAAAPTAGEAAAGQAASSVAVGTPAAGAAATGAASASAAGTASGAAASATAEGNAGGSATSAGSGGGASRPRFSAAQYENAFSMLADDGEAGVFVFVCLFACLI
jgi:hypothetical protein